MKNYIYTYDSDGQPSLNADAYHWLTKIGFIETQWILDTRWLSYDHQIAFHKWIDK